MEPWESVRTSKPSRGWLLDASRVPLVGTVIEFLQDLLCRPAPPAQLRSLAGGRHWGLMIMKLIVARRGQANPVVPVQVKSLATTLFLGVVILTASAGVASASAGDSGSAPDRAQDLVQYFERMCARKPIVARSGTAFTDHQAALRQRVQECVGLAPLPERGPLDARLSEPLDHPWCRIQGVSYQLWPGVRAGGLLYRPKEWREKPAPAVLCPHGHWSDGNAHPIVQSRCLMLARLGYVVYSPDQNHYEDLNWGISHQTLGVWGNMRALDFLETLTEVDGRRLGVCGASGGGLQTQMLVALDPRVRAATIVGMTCGLPASMLSMRWLHRA